MKKPIVCSVREHPELLCETIRYIAEKWASADSYRFYEDCITNAIATTSCLPQWYLLREDDRTIGCAGLITNDFISRMDLFPWMCALYIEEENRGRAYGALLIEKAKDDAMRSGFSSLYLATDHIGYYEKYGFAYIGKGYHPWGDESRIYEYRF